MKTGIQQLKPSEITSDVFIIAPSQIEWISKTFGDAVAETMNIRPLSQKIRKIAMETLIQVLNDAKKMGEQLKHLEKFYIYTRIYWDGRERAQLNLYDLEESPDCMGQHSG